MSDETVYVPRIVRYHDDEPLGVEGTVVGILNSNQSSRRATVLVEEPAENHRSDAPSPEGIEVTDLGYRELQEVAKENDLDIKLNQSTEDLRAAVKENL